MRITRSVMWMEMAHVASKRATCFRLNVGAVIVHHRSIVSLGYNGRPAGKPHCTGNTCPGRLSCSETTHAEENALSRLPSVFKTRSFEPKLSMYVTDSPCVECAKLIVHNGHINRVFFNRLYRLTDGLDRLMASGIKVYQVMPSGYIIDWDKKEIIDDPS